MRSLRWASNPKWPLSFWGSLDRHTQREDDVNVQGEDSHLQAKQTGLRMKPTLPNCDFELLACSTVRLSYSFFDLWLTQGSLITSGCYGKIGAIMSDKLDFTCRVLPLLTWLWSEFLVSGHQFPPSQPQLTLPATVEVGPIVVTTEEKIKTIVSGA